MPSSIFNLQLFRSSALRCLMFGYLVLGASAFSPSAPALLSPSAPKLLSQSAQQRRPLNTLSLRMGPLDGWIAAAKYRETCPPQSCIEQLLLDQIRSQNFDANLLHWAHPASMVLLVAPLILYSASLGWKLRTQTGGSASTETPVSATDPAPALDSEDADEATDAEPPAPPVAQLKEEPKGLSGKERQAVASQHALLMSVAAGISVFGIQGGLGSMLLAKQPILESPHAASAFGFLALFGLQGGIASNMGSNKLLRSVHAYLGSALVGLLVIHAALGLGLGFSFQHPTRIIDDDGNVISAQMHDAPAATFTERTDSFS